MHDARFKLTPPVKPDAGLRLVRCGNLAFNVDFLASWSEPDDGTLLVWMAGMERPRLIEGVEARGLRWYLRTLSAEVVSAEPPPPAEAKLPAWQPWMGRLLVRRAPEPELIVAATGRTAALVLSILQEYSDDADALRAYPSLITEDVAAVQCWDAWKATGSNRTEEQALDLLERIQIEHRTQASGNGGAAPTLFPGRSADGCYHFPDGSMIRPDRDRWLAVRPDGIGITSCEPGGPITFASPYDAAQALETAAKASGNGDPLVSEHGDLRPAGMVSREDD